MKKDLLDNICRKLLKSEDKIHKINTLINDALAEIAK